MQQKKDPTINLGYFRKEIPGSHCGYCDTNNSISSGFNVEIMTPNIYQQLIDRGWRRCGVYFYTHHSQRTCCLIYTIRLHVDKYVLRKSHKKSAKKMMNFLHNPKLLDKTATIKELLNAIQPDSKIAVQQEVSVTDKSKTQLIQDPSKVQKHQQGVVEQSLINDLKAIFLSIIGQLQHPEHKLRLLKCLSIEDESSPLQIDEGIAHQCKIFPSQLAQKGDLYSNFIMLIYGKNKKTLLKKFTVELFTAHTNQFFMEMFQHHTQFLFALDKSGYLSIFHPQKQQNHQQQLQKIDKVKLPDVKMKIETEEAPKQSLISYDPATWMPNNFKVGGMKITLKKAAFEQEAFALYVKYCSEVHGKKETSVDGYTRFLCENSLDASIKKSTVDGKTLLFVGCYHMCYYLQDKLVAVGVVDIMEESLSSVYFFYDPMFEKLQFGTFGSLVEIEYVTIMKRYFPEFRYYYLGYYIQACQKMVYKANYGPCELLCPTTYTWVALDATLTQTIDERTKQKPSERQVTISQANVVDDMNFNKVHIVASYTTQMDKRTFYHNNVKISIKGEVLSIRDLNPQGQFYVEEYLDLVLPLMGKKLVSEITFTA